MNIFSTALRQQDQRLATIYGAKSSIQYRASNMCNLLLGYIVVTTALILFAILVDRSGEFKAKRLFYIGFLGTMTLSYVAFYGMILKRHFRV